MTRTVFQSKVILMGKQEEHKKKPGVEHGETIQVHCPKCQRTKMFYLQSEPMPVCTKCKIEMVFSELLDEGKSY